MYCFWRIKDSAAIKALRNKTADMEVVSVPTRKRVSLKSNTLKSEKQKVNDEMVNSIIIGTNVPCSGKDTQPIVNSGSIY